MKKSNRKIKWLRGVDWLDGTPRYTIEGHGDLSYTDVPFVGVVIYQEREREYRGGPKRPVWYGVVRECHREHEVIIGPCRYLKHCKQKTEREFHKMMSQLGQ